MSSIEVNAGSPAGTVRAARASDPIGGRIIVGFLGYLVLLALAWIVLDRWVPDRLTVHLLGHGLTISEFHRHVLNHAWELALVFPALLVGEMAINGWANSSLRLLTATRTASAMSDLTCYLLWETKVMNVAIIAMTLGLSLASGVWLHGRLMALTGQSFSAAAWPVWAQVPVLFLIFTFFDYWNHRLDHSSLFWPLHRFHHAADDFCILTAGRVHPAVFTGVIAGVMPAVVLGASPDAVFDLLICSSLLRYTIHSRIDSNFGWIGRWVVQSPTHHRLHHALDISKTPVGHFSLAPVWDHLFGTWVGEADQSLAIGVNDAPYRHGVWIVPDLWRDYGAFWRGLWRSLVQAGPKPATAPAPASTPS